MSIHDRYTGPERRAPMDLTIDESWMKFLAKMGMGGIAVFLVYQMSVKVEQNVTETNQAIKTHVAASIEQEHVSDRIMRTLLNVTVQQCVNAALTIPKRDACFEALTSAPVRNPR